MADTILYFANSVPALVSSFSLAYLCCFLPVVILLYAIAPRKWKRWVLLAASYVFYWLISGKLLVYLILSTVSTYFFGLWLDYLQVKRKLDLSKLENREEKRALKKKYQSRQRWILILGVIVHIGVLLKLKYSAFFAVNINALSGWFGSSLAIDIPNYILPIGISFYTMQALAYIMDVYYGKISAEENPFRLALFMAFFPQIVEGPICRYSDTAETLWNCRGITFNNLTFGMQRILYGMMKKIVVADRLDPLVKEVFHEYQNYPGGMIAFAAVCYTIQLYMDFSGSMDAVIGSAQIFGIKMPENFERPFFSRSISEFWRRWHITLGLWFRDYIFYPVTMAKPMKSLTLSARKKLGNHFGSLPAGAIALFCVWFSNGLWHGPAWHYIFFGMYHFALILGGNMIEPAGVKLRGHLHSEWTKQVYHVMQIVRTGILVVIGELFFRANGLRAGFAMVSKMVSDISFPQVNDALLLQLGVDRHDALIVAVTLIIVFVVSVLNERGICVREALARQKVVVRWIILYAFIAYIVVFGAYGIGYVPVDPMYAGF